MLRPCFRARFLFKKHFSSPRLVLRRAASMTGVKIGTHSGTFHCDEALGCYLLSKTHQFSNGTVHRSRDPAIWKEMDVLIDVGGEYNHDTCRYDHHQREFGEVFGNGFKTKLSSAGLVYKHYGLEIVANFMGKPADDPDVKTVWLRVYKDFVEAVDANDNGVNQFPDAGDPLYHENTTLPKRVGFLNPQWNETATSDAIDARFAEAVALTGREFEDSLRSAATSWLPARSIVASALKSATAVHSSGGIMLLKPFCPWKSHVYDLEQELGCMGRTLYVVYQDDRDGSWRVQGVGTSPASFDLRKPLPEPWRGIRDDELSAVSGIQDCVFVHASGFIGGNKSEEGIMKMAMAALVS